MHLIIVSGLSGAGKSSVMRILEDNGCYCVNNLPAPLVSTFLQLTNDANEPHEQIAVGVDIRGVEFYGSDRNSESLTQILDAVESYRSQGYAVESIFLEASTEVLIKRYKETRRIHPLFTLNPDTGRIGERVGDAIEEERLLLKPLRDRADVILDTSSLLVRDLKQEIDRIYAGGSGVSNFYLTFISFGYKYGIPTDADLVLDVRFLPNPYYVDELKPLTGEDPAVAEYVMATDEAAEFRERILGLLDFLIPQYRVEGKTGLVVAVGCTGGKHRSVTLTNVLYDYYKSSEYGCKKTHRDIDKDRVRKAGDLQR